MMLKEHLRKSHSLEGPPSWALNVAEVPAKSYTLNSQMGIAKSCESSISKGDSSLLITFTL